MYKKFVTGDTHGDYDIHKLNSSNFLEGKTLTKSDNVIILGDFGLLWANPPTDTELHWLSWLQKKSWTTLVVDGNHCNFNMLYQLPEIPMFGGTVREIRPSIYWLQRGQVYQLGGDKVFVFGGGTSIDKARRVEGKSWWPQEIPSQQEQDLAWSNIRKWKEVDYVLTHAAPKNIMADYKMSHRGLMEYFCPVEHMLQDMLDTLKFKRHYHGHLHCDTQLRPKHVCLYQTVLELGKNLDSRFDAYEED